MAAKQNKPSVPKETKRPPVVVVLGHVDHGKTTLLDTIRKTKVAAGEAGGITQHIGAYQVRIRPEDPSSTITFIDTPGHEAFSKMRSRGAQVADLAILVVAANDGVKPQTKEAIAHIKKANLPFIVAINKIDIEGVHPDVVKGQLAENEVYVEGYGGDVVALGISAKQGTGIQQLLEMLELLYELQETDTGDTSLKAVVLESYIDAQKGVVANLLLRSGYLSVGQMVYCQTLSAKIRSLISDGGQPIGQAVASQPVQVLGFKEVLPIGEVVTDKSIEKAQPVVVQTPNNGENKESETEEEQRKLKIILKTDVAGSLEAIKANLTEEVELVGEGIGDISESDVLLARSTGAKLIGFHIRVPKVVQKLAEMEEVKIETFDVIYHLLEDLQKRVLKLMEPTINEEVLGKAEIIAEFKIRGTHIAGCKVAEGMLVRSEKARVLRGERIIAEPRISAMQIERQEAKEAKKGQEVALVFRPDVGFKVGDIIMSYKIIED